MVEEGMLRVQCIPKGQTGAQTCQFTLAEWPKSSKFCCEVKTGEMNGL